MLYIYIWKPPIVFFPKIQIWRLGNIPMFRGQHVRCCVWCVQFRPTSRLVEVILPFCPKECEIPSIQHTNILMWVLCCRFFFVCVCNIWNYVVFAVYLSLFGNYALLSWAVNAGRRIDIILPVMMTHAVRQIGHS